MRKIDYHPIPIVSYFEIRTALNAEELTLLFMLPCCICRHAWIGDGHSSCTCCDETIVELSSGNIGNAILANLKEILNMKGEQYNVALAIFSVSYTVLKCQRIWR